MFTVSNGSIIVNICDETKTSEIIQFVSSDEDYIVPKFIEHNNEKYNITSIKNNAFSGSQIKNITFPNDSCIENIGSSAFENCNNLEYILIKSSLLKNFDSIFINCERLYKVSIHSENDIEITPKVFYGCNSLLDVTITSSKNLHLISDCFNEAESIKKVELKGKNITIDDNCFNDCYSLCLFKISESENVSIGKNQFFNCVNLNEISVSASSKIEFREYCFVGAFNLRAFIIVGGDVIIKDDILSDFTSLCMVSIIQTKSVFIDSKQFQKCKNIELVNIESETKVDIGSNCFENCNNLKKIRISAFDISIGDECFKNCSLLKNFEFKETNKIKLGTSSFHGCKNLDDVFISSSYIIDIEEKCFCDATNVKKLFLNAKRIFIKSESFKGCSSMKKIKIVSMKKNVTGNNDNENVGFSYSSYSNIENIMIGNNAFAQINKLEEVCINAENEVFMCDYCFFKNPELKQVTVYASDIHFGDYCFSNCSKLSYITVPAFANKFIEKKSFKKTKAIIQQIEAQENIINRPNMYFEITEA